MTDTASARPPLNLHALPSYVLAVLLLAASWGEFSRLRWLGLGPSAIPLTYAALLLLGVGSSVVLQRRGIAVLTTPLDRALLLACSLLVASASVSASLAADRERAFLALFELAAAAALLVIALSVDRAHLLRALSLAALTSICINALLCLAGPGVGGLLAPRSWPYQAEVHQHLGGWPRFYGLSVTPFGLGVSMFANVGLVQAWPVPRVRRCATAAALVMALLSFSFCTLLVPLWLWARIERRWLRRSCIGLTLAAALGVLFVHPIALHVGTKQLVLGALHPRYDDDGLGPRHMPLQTLRVGEAAFVYHFTGYYYLAERALACTAVQPWFGVGGGNAPRVCKTWIMNTYGVWSHEGRLHNEYLNALAELGCLGVAAALGVAFTLQRRYALGRAHVFCYAAVLAVLSSGLASRAIVHVPSLLLLASSLRLRAATQPDAWRAPPT